MANKENTRSVGQQVKWIGGQEVHQPVKGLEHKNVYFYQKCIYGPLTLTVGDFILVSNADAVEPDTVSGCDVARILHMYELREVTDRETCRAIVQWYSWPKAIPHNKFDDDDVAIDFSLEVIEEHRPYDNDVALGAIYHHHNPHDMNKLCRQVSIESPGPGAKNCVFNFFVPIEDTPAMGARIRIVCAGACYRRRDRANSITSMSSVSSELSDYCPSVNSMSSPAHQGIREGSFFPGFEVAGVIESLGSEITEANNRGLRIGQRVIVYPFDETPAGYAELLVVPDLKYVVPIPDSLPMEVAAMLPTGALLAWNAVFKAQAVVTQILSQRAATEPKRKPKILIVGTGGLALWAVRIASYHFATTGADDVDITVASLRDEGFRLATEIKK